MTITTQRGRRRSHRTVRTAVVAGAVSLGLAVLAACEKPTPMATVTVGSESVGTEAACYNDGHPLSQKDIASCQQADPGKTIKVGLGDIIRLGVEPEIAEQGWVLYVNGSPGSAQPWTKTYRSISSDAFFSPQGMPGGDGPLEEVKLTIAEQDKANTTYGVWHVTLELEQDS